MQRSTLMLLDGITQDTVSSQLVGFVEFAPTLLSLVGIKSSQYVQAKALLGQLLRKGQLTNAGRLA